MSATHPIAPLALLALALTSACAGGASRAAKPAGSAATETTAEHQIEYDQTRIVESSGDATGGAMTSQPTISGVWTAEENTRAQILPSGLRILDLKSGKGATVQGDGAEIMVHYTLWLTDGTQVDTSRGSRHGPFAVPIPGQLIDGWNEGLVGMAVGGVRKLYVPAKLGYGATGFPPDIAPNEDLVFEIECLGVGAPPAAR